MFRDIAQIFADLAGFARNAAIYCSSVPVLGGALAGFFNAADSKFRDAFLFFIDADNAFRDLDNRILDFLPWDGIAAQIRATWGIIDDIPGAIAAGIVDVISSQYSEITDFWGNVAAGIVDVISSQYSEITDFWGNVAAGIEDWFTEKLPGWAEDRAEDMIALAGRILDKVW